MRSKNLAHLAVLAANLLFAINFSVAKLITPLLIKPFGLNVVRAGVSVILFWFLYLMKPSATSIQKKHIGRFLICAATGVALNQMSFIKGLSYTTPIHAVLLMLATPIFITFIAAWLLKEGLGFMKVLGLVLGVGGAVILVTLKENTGGGTHIILGDILVLTNAIAYAFYLVLVRPLMKAYSALFVIRWVFTLGFLMILPFGLQEFTQVDWPSFTLNNWIALAFVVLGATFFAYLFNIYGLQHLSASVTGAYIYTQPIFASIIAMVFYGEDFSVEKGISALLIFGGVYLVTYKKNETALIES